MSLRFTPVVAQAVRVARVHARGRVGVSLRYDFYGAGGKWGVFSDVMRALAFLPLAFVADFYGFAIFAPYVGLVLVAVYVEGRVKAGRARAVGVGARDA